jgi:hypothetical protein
MPAWYMIGGQISGHLWALTAQDDVSGRLLAWRTLVHGSWSLLLLLRFRNLEFLENELEAYYQAEQEKLEAQERRLKKMQKRLA